MSSPRDDLSRDHTAPADRGGVLLSYQDSDDRPVLAFIPASVAARLTALTCAIDVPGARPPARGLALADGEVITVLELGKRATAAPPPYLPGADWPVPGSDRAVLCVLGSVRVALTGGTVVATGVFDPIYGGGGVLWRGEPVPTLDVRALYARAETAIWAERAVSSRPSAPPSGRSIPPSGRSLPPSGRSLPPSGRSLPPSGRSLPPSGRSLPPSSSHVPTQPSTPIPPRSSGNQGDR